MNTVISQTTNAHLWPLAPSLQSLVTARGGPANCERFELEDTVLRAGGFAWDIGAEAAARGDRAVDGGEGSSGRCCGYDITYIHNLSLKI